MVSDVAGRGVALDRTGISAIPPSGGHSLLGDDERRRVRRLRRRAAGQVPDRVVTLLLGIGVALLGALVAGNAMRPDSPVTAMGATGWLTTGRSWAALSVALLLAAAVARAPGRWVRLARWSGRRLERRPVRVALALAATCVFWLVSTRRMNLDGRLLQRKFEDAVPRVGAFVTPDEMLEFYLHSRLWWAADHLWGWDVAHTYQVVSCLVGGLAVYLALGLATRFPVGRRLLLATGLLSGAWVGVFFGDAENYTCTNLIALAYFALAYRFVREPARPLWPVAAVLGIGVLFHLQVLVFMPSLLVLLVLAVRRGRVRDAALSATIPPVLLLVTLAVMSRVGLQLSSLATTSQLSADGGQWGRYLAQPTGWVPLAAVPAGAAAGSGGGAAARRGARAMAGPAGPDVPVGRGRGWRGVHAAVAGAAGTGGGLEPVRDRRPAGPACGVRLAGGGAAVAGPTRPDRPVPGARGGQHLDVGAREPHRGRKLIGARYLTATCCGGRSGAGTCRRRR